MNEHHDASRRGRAAARRSHFAAVAVTALLVTAPMACAQLIGLEDTPTGGAGAIDGGGEADGTIDDDGAVDASGDRVSRDVTVIVRDGGRDVGADVACPGAPPTKSQLGTWKPPPPFMAACSSSDLATFSNNLSTAATYNDAVKGLTPTCKSCILSHTDDPKWTFVVVDSNDPDAGNGFFNWGACYAIKSGSTACGNAVQNQQFCVTLSCETCPDTPSFTKCLSASATTQGCSSVYSGDISAGCGTDASALQDYDMACNSAQAAANVMCGTGP